MSEPETCEDCGFPDCEGPCERCHECACEGGDGWACEDTCYRCDDSLESCDCEEPFYGDSGIQEERMCELGAVA